MEYTISHPQVTLKLGARGIYLDHPFEKKINKYSIYEIKEGDILYVNIYSMYMGYFWVRREYLNRFNIKITEKLGEDIKIYDYDYDINEMNFNNFIKIEKKEIKRVRTDRKHIKEYLEKIGIEVIEEKKDVDVDLIEEVKPYILSKDVFRVIDDLLYKTLTKIEDIRKGQRFYIEYLLSSKLSEINPYAVVAAAWLKKKGLVDKEIVFYSFTCSYRAHMLNEYILKETKGVFLYTGRCNDKYDKYGYLLPEHLISCLDNFKVIVYTALSAFLPSKAKKLYIKHDIFDSPFGYGESVITINNKKYLTPVMEDVDIIALPNRLVQKKHQDIFKKANAKDKTYLLGYMKFDNMYKRLKDIKAKNKYIVYAPSLLDKKDENHHSIPYFGEELIERLLLRGYKVVFRPHPQNSYFSPNFHPLIKRIVKKFKKYKNFIFDIDANDYLYYYANSKILITDISGTAYTYAFLTNKPTLFLSPNEKFIKKDLGDLEFFRLREKIGKVVYNLDSLEKNIEELIKKKPLYKLKIKKLRNKFIANFGKSENELLYLIDILS